MSALPVEQTAPEQALTVADVASMLKVSEDTVYHRARTGDLPAVKVGRQWRFWASEIRASLTPKPVDLWSQPAAARRARGRRPR